METQIMCCLQLVNKQQDKKTRSKMHHAEMQSFIVHF